LILFDDDVLDVTRIESQTFNLKKQKFDLDEVVTTVIDGYRNQIENSNSNEKT
jgi:K+-sensing histidine kinase KdpD